MNTPKKTSDETTEAALERINGIVHESLDAKVKFFASHARTVTLVVRGDSLEKSMSHYLVEQLRAQSNVNVQLRAEVVAAHGDTHLSAVDIRDNATDEVRRHDCGGLFVFIGADAETEWLPTDIADHGMFFAVLPQLTTTLSHGIASTSAATRARSMHEWVPRLPTPDCTYSLPSGCSVIRPS